MEQEDNGEERTSSLLQLCTCPHSRRIGLGEPLAVVNRMS